MNEKIDLGGFRVTPVSGGRNRLDGGGMLGILPKVVWERWYPADAQNRIELETHCLLVECGSERILIESGCGNKLGEKERAFYSVDPEDWIGENLRRLGVPLESITKVLLTHLHTDHAGGVVTRDGSGRLAPTFPNAEVFVTQTEWETARDGKGISQNAYNADNYRVLETEGLLRKVNFDAEVLPGVRFMPTPGHTLGHASVVLTGDRSTLVFTGDLLPLARQTIPHYNMAYDTHPVLKAETKTAFMKRAHEGNWILALSHEPNTAIGRLQFDPQSGRYSLKALQDV